MESGKKHICDNKLEQRIHNKDLGMLYVETKVTTTQDMYKKWNKTSNSEDLADPPTIGYPGTIPSEAPNVSYNSKFSDDDIRLLREFLVNGEKYKWKQVTKEINNRSLGRRYDSYETGRHPGPKNDNDEGAGAPNSPKNVSPTFVMKQYQAMLGLPNHAVHFGTLGSSLPYVVAPNGWDDIPNVD